MVVELRGILSRARELAHKRRQPLTTAHALVALFQQDTAVAQVLARSGLSEVRLLGALEHVYEERTNALDLALERAARLAGEAGAPHARAGHLLVAITCEARCAAYASLLRMGSKPDAICAAASAAFGVRAAPALSARPVALDVTQAPQAQRAPQAAPPEPSRASVARAAHPMRARVRRDRGLRSAVLAEETETKLLRRLAGSTDENAPPGPQAEPTRPTARLRGRSLRPTHAASTNASMNASTNTTMTTATDADAARRQTTSASARFELDKQRFPLLTSIGRNLTQLAHEGHLDAVVGRGAEIEQVLDVLARRRGNNPVLVGPPGVGKTAIVEGLALCLAQPASGTRGLQEKILVEVPVSGLLAGTGVRGALSERVQVLKREVAQSAGRVLLFIDEIHTVLAGSEGADSLGNELKTALARGELPLVGATTDGEYRRYFERDAALARRFTRIEVAEPSRADALTILQGIAPYYETHHGVRYEAAALSAAVELSVRYLTEQKLPDKAIGLIDQAAARARRRGLSKVDETQVAGVVSELSQVPIERLLMKDGEALLALESQLSTRVVGQLHASQSIANALRKSAAGFRGTRPLGTFLFLGPTGVGKTEMAKAIADQVFPGAPMTRIDMSELGEAHAVARLFGAPPGYIGHEDGGQLTEAVRHRPYQLVLLDEIEKAHMDVLLALLPLLDEGRLTDGRGRTVDFTNTVIVMTSNLGAECALSRARIGFSDDVVAAPADRGEQARALAAARAALPPELWNRIDEPLYFHPLSEQDVAQIARRMLLEVADVARDKHGVTLEVNASAIAALVMAGGFDRALGARPMRRTISRLVEAPLSHALLAGELSRGDCITLCGEGALVRWQHGSVLAAAAE